MFAPKSETAWIVLYRPPRCPPIKLSEALEFVQEWITKVENFLGKIPTIYLTGDFNMASMGDWSPDVIENMTSNPSARNDSDNTIGEDKEQILLLLSFIQDWSLCQEVKEKTHGNNILDLIFTNNTESIDEVEILENFKISDHSMIVAKLHRDSIKDTEETLKNFCTTQIPKYNLRRASVQSWEAARDQFQKIDFSDDHSPEELTKDLIEALEKVVVENFEVHAPPSRDNNKSRSYIPREARCLLKRKLNAGRSLKKTSDPDTKEALEKKISDIEESLRKLIHTKRIKDENKARKDLANAPEDFFSLVRKITKKVDKVGPLKRNTENQSWPSCEILSSQYTSVFSNPRQEDILPDPEHFFLEELSSAEVNVSPKLTSFVVSPLLIGQALDKLPAKSSPGPDGIPNLLLKQLKFQIISVLYKIFNKSLETGIVPSQFLNAYVKPIKKSKKP